MLFTGLDGTGRHDSAMTPDEAVPFAAQLVAIDLKDGRFQIDTSRPFVAFMSESQGFLCVAVTSQSSQRRVTAEPRSRNGPVTVQSRSTRGHATVVHQPPSRPTPPSLTGRLPASCAALQRHAQGEAWQPIVTCSIFSHYLTVT